MKVTTEISFSIPEAVDKNLRDAIRNAINRELYPIEVSLDVISYVKIERNLDELPNENWEFVPRSEWTGVTWNLPMRRKTHQEGGFTLLFLHEFA